MFLYSNAGVLLFCFLAEKAERRKAEKQRQTAQHDAGPVKSHGFGETDQVIEEEEHAGESKDELQGKDGR